MEPEDAKGLLFQDLQDDVAKEVARTLRPQSLGPLWSTTSFAAWKHVPTTYVICEDYIPSTVAAAGFLVSSAQATEGNKVDTVVKIKAGHSPMLSQPERTAHVLRQAAGEKLV